MSNLLNSEPNGINPVDVSIKNPIQTINELDNKLKELYDILHKIPNAFFIFNDQGFLLEMSNSFCSLFGVERPQVLGQHLDTIMLNGNNFIAASKTSALNGKISWVENLHPKFAKPVNAEITVELTSSNVCNNFIALINNLNKINEAENNCHDREIQLQHHNELLMTLNDDLAESYRQIQIINEQLLETKEKAVESDRLKTAFLANMSHEIRTPMIGIIGFAHMLTEKNLDQESVDQYVSIINNCSHQLLTIIDDIIDISKIEAGQLKINAVQTNINDLLFELHSFYTKTAHEASIELEVLPGLTTDKSSILADPVRMRQILSNLINNALKFTRKGKVSFGYVLKNNEIEFFVTDTGIGIAPEYHSLIFERFRQVEHTETLRYRGTGLGLAICKALVKMMKGQIWVESVIDQGSTFFFKIPAIMLKSSTLGKFSANGKKEIIDLQGKTILIAEDEEYNYMFLDELLKNTGATIIWAKNGVEAVEICKQSTPLDLILMDIKMPLMNGFEATKKIKPIRPGLPIIAQTAYAMADDKEKAKDAGCDNYITKPIDKSDLFTMIYQYFAPNQVFM